MSSEHKNLTADMIYQTIVELRADHDYCTIRMIADQLDVSTNTAFYWVRRLIDDDRITRTGRPGSITPR